MIPPENAPFYGQPDHRDDYRYWLHRDIGAGEGSVLFIMLNPSEALSLGDQNDPTVRGCMRYARRWQYRDLTVVNLFAYRSANPDDLLRRPNETIGEHNDAAIEWAVGSIHNDGGRIVCAWGDQGILGHRDRHVLNVLNTLNIQGYCLRLTVKKRRPRHPRSLTRNIELDQLIPMPAGQ